MRQFIVPDRLLTAMEKQVPSGDCCPLGFIFYHPLYLFQIFEEVLSVGHRRMFFPSPGHVFIATEPLHLASLGIRSSVCVSLIFLYEFLGSKLLSPLSSHSRGEKRGVCGGGCVWSGSWSDPGPDKGDYFD